MARQVETLRHPPRQEWPHPSLAWLPYADLAAWYPLALLLAAGALLRVAPWLAAYPLHRDEALYGAWARAIAGGADPWLLAAWVDKPPLVLYLLAASLRAWGVSDLALRGPAMLASLLTVGATYGLARRMAARHVALLAAGLVACSPFAILFAPTAFTDPWLALWLVLAAWAALARRPFWAGLALGLAVASKQNGVLGVPLVLALLWVGRHEVEAGGVCRARRVVRELFVPALCCALGFAVAFAPVYWWDTLRWATRPSFWDRSLQTYGGLYLAAPADWAARAARWAEQAGYLWGTPLLSGAVLLLAGCGALRRRPGSGRLAAPLVLAAYSLGYLLVHWLVTFQTWDRYLLPLVPFLAILAALGTARLWEELPHRWPLIAAGVLLLAWPAWLGTAGRVPVGSDHYAFAGLDQAVATLQDLPEQSVIYHRSLGWHLDYYLFGRPQPRVWWAEPETLAGDAYDVATRDPGRAQWLAVAWATDEPVMAGMAAALQRRGLGLAERQRIYRRDGTLAFTLYQILPPGQAR